MPQGPYYSCRDIHLHLHLLVSFDISIYPYASAQPTLSHIMMALSPRSRKRQRAQSPAIRSIIDEDSAIISPSGADFDLGSGMAAQPPVAPTQHGYIYNVDVDNISNKLPATQAMTVPLPIRNQRDYCSVNFEILPDLKASVDETHGPWVAYLFVVCDSICDLMSVGSFAWARYEVVHEKSRMFDPDPEHGHTFTYAREYFLRDRADPAALGSRVKGLIQVYGESIAALAGIDLDVDIGQHLPQNISWAQARDRDRKKVYQFSVRDPSENINCIYDMKPLTDLWPWPLNSAEDLEDGKDDGNGDTDRKTGTN